MVIINPGSENKGGTLEQAKINANKWLKNIHNEGFYEVNISEGKRLDDGDYEFIFTHNITKKEVKLHIHGFTEEECKKFIFHPRVYWNGSSTADPKIEDWLTDEYTYRIKYYKK